MPSDSPNPRRLPAPTTHAPRFARVQRRLARTCRYVRTGIHSRIPFTNSSSSSSSSFGMITAANLRIGHLEQTVAELRGELQKVHATHQHLLTQLESVAREHETLKQEQHQTHTKLAHTERLCKTRDHLLKQHNNNNNKNNQRRRHNRIESILLSDATDRISDDEGVRVGVGVVGHAPHHCRVTDASDSPEASLEDAPDNTPPHTPQTAHSWFALMTAAATN
jgi:uncharacterized membrane protein